MTLAISKSDMKDGRHPETRLVYLGGNAFGGMFADRSASVLGQPLFGVGDSSAGKASDRG
jgi:hypothetical protein